MSVAAIQAGLPMESVAMTVNRLCSSALQAVVTTAQNILLGDCDFGIGGGGEVMSRGAYLSPAMRNGARMGETKMFVATLTDPFGTWALPPRTWRSNGASRASNAKMKPAFKKDGSVTAGNASGINDGAAFLVLADADAAKAAGSKPLARLVSYAVAGVPNEIMGEGPIPATRLALKKAGLKLDQFDLIESNEALPRRRSPSRAGSSST
jgi:acetyl-CoA C-acetyltransferase